MLEGKRTLVTYVERHAGGRTAYAYEIDRTRGAGRKIIVARY